MIVTADRDVLFEYCLRKYWKAFLNIIISFSRSYQAKMSKLKEKGQMSPISFYKWLRQDFVPWIKKENM